MLVGSVNQMDWKYLQLLIALRARASRSNRAQRLWYVNQNMVSCRLCLFPSKPPSRCRFDWHDHELCGDHNVNSNHCAHEWCRTAVAMWMWECVANARVHWLLGGRVIRVADTSRNTEATVKGHCYIDVHSRKNHPKACTCGWMCVVAQSARVPALLWWAWRSILFTWTYGLFDARLLRDCILLVVIVSQSTNIWPTVSAYMFCFCVCVCSWDLNIL